MIVVGKDKLIKFIKRHGDARPAMLRWLKIMEESCWGGFMELKATFGSADIFSRNRKSYIIFNIGGNKYRLIVAVNFKGAIAVIEMVMTHAEYSKDAWKGRL